MRNERVCWLVALAAQSLLGAACAQPATATQAWRPDRPVTIVVPYAQGGGTDASARAVARKLTLIWGQPVTIKNSPGAEGTVGTQTVMQAPGDGYTLLMQVPSLVLMRQLSPAMHQDPLTSLTAVSVIAQSPQVLVGSTTVPAKTLRDLVQHCRAAASSCQAGVAESVGKLMLRSFAQEAGLPGLKTVSYRGTTAMVHDLMLGRITFALSGAAASVPMHNLGTLRVLAVSADARLSKLPDVPTSAEAGFPGLKVMTWYGLFAPASTPAPVIDAISQAVRLAGQDAEVTRAIAMAGAQPVFSKPSELAGQVRLDAARYGGLAARFRLDP